MRRGRVAIPLLAFGVSLALGTGCMIEPYPHLSTAPLAFDEVPATVRKAFLEGYRRESVTGVELATFDSRFAGFRKYRFTLDDGQTITLDDRGRLTRWPPVGPSTRPDDVR